MNLIRTIPMWKQNTIENFEGLTEQSQPKHTQKKKENPCINSQSPKP